MKTHKKNIKVLILTYVFNMYSSFERSYLNHLPWKKKSKRPANTPHTKRTVHICKNKVDFVVILNFSNSMFALEKSDG